MTDTPPTKQEVLENQYDFYEATITALEKISEDIAIAGTPTEGFLVDDQRKVKEALDVATVCVENLARRLDASKENIRRRLDAATEAAQEYGV